MKKFFSFIIVNISILILSSSAFAQVSYKNVNLAGLNANVVTVDLNEEIKIRTAKPDNKQVGVMSFQSFINIYEAKAAINGNYFEAYKGGNFPYGTQMKNKQMVNMEGNSASLMVFDDYKVKLTEGTFKYNGYLDGKRKNEWNNDKNKMDFNVFSVWYVNVLPSDTTGVYIYNSFRNAPTKLNGGYVVEVVNDTVKRVFKPSETEMKLPENGYIIYYGKDAATSDYVSERFKPGRKVELELIMSKKTKDGTTLFNSFKYGKEEISLSKVTDIISAGPMLIEDGKKVFAESMKGMEAKISTGAGARSVVGLTKDNKLLLVTTSGTMEQIANLMINLGCSDAFNLDGGASCALYANGKYLRHPGRNLNTVLLIQKNNN